MYGPIFQDTSELLSIYYVALALVDHGGVTECYVIMTSNQDLRTMLVLYNYNMQFPLDGKTVLKLEEKKHRSEYNNFKVQAK